MPGCLRPPTCPFCKPHLMYVSLSPSPLISMILGRPAPASRNPSLMPWAPPMSRPSAGSKKPGIILSGAFRVDCVLWSPLLLP